MTRLRRPGAVALGTLLILAVGAFPLAAQDYAWSEIKFHRVHLINGNFIDGEVMAATENYVQVKLQVGEMTIRKNTIERIELMKMRSLLEKPKLDPPLKKAVLGKPAVLVARAKSPGAFLPAPASEELASNVASYLSRLKVATPDQKEGLIDDLARLEHAGAYMASLLPTMDEESCYMLRSALMRSKDHEAIPYLTRDLDCEKVYVQLQAIVLLGILGESSNGDALRPFLRSPVAVVRATTIDALRQLNDAGSVDSIAELVGEQEDMVRISAITASIELGRTNNRMDVVTTWVRRHLTSSEGRVAKELLMAVARGKMTDLWAQVAAFLNDGDPLIRRTAAIALQSIPVAEVTDSVVSRLSLEDDSRVLVELIRAAALLKSTHPIPPLIHLLRSQAPEVTQASGNALAVLTGQKFGTDDEKWSKWWNRNMNTIK